MEIGQPQIKTCLGWSPCDRPCGVTGRVRASVVNPHVQITEKIDHKTQTALTHSWLNECTVRDYFCFNFASKLMSLIMPEDMQQIIEHESFSQQP